MVQRGEEPGLAERLRATKKKLRFYQTFTVFFILSAAAFLLVASRPLLKRIISEFNFLVVEKEAPHSKEIKALIKPLRYSYLYTMTHDNVKISIDFLEKIWYLHNIYQYDEDGNILLEQGRYGICGELAAYVYQKIVPLFGENYKIEFVRVSESGYFPVPKWTHFVLRIEDKTSTVKKILNVSYIVDPSLRRYAKSEKFDDYYFIERFDTLDFIKNKEKDGVNAIGGQVPILIRKEYLLGFGVDAMHGKLDRDNFVLMLVATRRYKYTGRIMFTIRRVNGQNTFIEDKMLALNILKEDEYKLLRDKIIDFFEDITGDRLPI